MIKSNFIFPSVFQKDMFNSQGTPWYKNRTGRGVQPIQVELN